MFIYLGAGGTIKLSEAVSSAVLKHSSFQGYSTRKSDLSNAVEPSDPTYEFDLPYLR